MIMELWIARDKGTNELWCYTDKPVLNADSGMYSADFSLEHTISYELYIEWFPEITFENSPQKVRLEIVKEEEV